jgi:hypothetical protein
MPVKLEDVIASVKVAAPELEQTAAQRAAVAAVRACGLDVAPNGELFNPAEGAYRMSKPRPQWSAPQDNSRRSFGRRR